MGTVLFAIAQGFFAVFLLGIIAFVLFALVSFVRTLLRTPRKRRAARPRTAEPSAAEPEPEPRDDEWLNEFG